MIPQLTLSFSPFFLLLLSAPIVIILEYFILSQISKQHFNPARIIALNAVSLTGTALLSLGYWALQAVMYILPLIIVKELHRLTEAVSVGYRISFWFLLMVIFTLTIKVLIEYAITLRHFQINEINKTILYINLLFSNLVGLAFLGACLVCIHNGIASYYY